MRSTKLSSVMVAATALLLTAPTGALAAPKLPKHKGHVSPAGCRLSESADPRIVNSGDSVVLTGVLNCPGGGPTGQIVTVFERIAGVPGGFKNIGTTTTTGGSYSFTPAPVITDSTFYTRAAGARSANHTVRVAPQVTVATSPPLPEGSQLFTGPAHRVTFKGSVNPIDRGAEVLLQRETGGSTEEWGTIQRHGFVRADGSFEIIHTFVVPGDANLRAVVRPHGMFDARGISNVLTYEISQTQNPNLTLEPSADPVNFGSPLTLHGVVKAGSGQKVILMARSFGSPSTKIGETTSGAGGAFEFKIASEEKNTSYRALSGTIGSAILFEGVKWVVDSAAVSATKVTSGQEVTFSGTVSPDRVGHFVYLERKNAAGDGYHVVDLGTVSFSNATTGTFTIKYPVIGSGMQQYRIHIPGDPINQATSSSPFVLEVTPALSTLKPPLQPKLPD
ncbi:MAG TPA: hypothetical protein VNY31_00155 [Solirubrobacteraceae bacterium]|nr:hypothetical protein [Solirubrobacteraceae bacterium]